MWDNPHLPIQQINKQLTEQGSGGGAYAVKNCNVMYFRTTSEFCDSKTSPMTMANHTYRAKLYNDL